MHIINLDENFTPFKFSESMSVSSFVFPSKCEVHIKLPNINISRSDAALITTRIKSSDDIMILLMATDALKRSGIKGISIFIPYLPYARQDRQMVTGEPLSLKVFAQLLNLQGYSKVIVYDVHSETSLALINNSICITNHDFVHSILHKKEQDYFIVSPDAGAYKKIFKLCQHLKYKGEIVMCNKIRDVSNGVIRSMTVSHTDLQGKDCYIIDDICDGGGTFVALAAELKKRNVGQINLIVSHGIFSKGLDVLNNIDRIYTTNAFSDLPENQKLTQIKLNDSLLS